MAHTMDIIKPYLLKISEVWSVLDNEGYRSLVDRALSEIRQTYDNYVNEFFCLSAGSEKIHSDLTYYIKNVAKADLETPVQISKYVTDITEIILYSLFLMTYCTIHKWESGLENPGDLTNVRNSAWYGEAYICLAYKHVHGAIINWAEMLNQLSTDTFSKVIADIDNCIPIFTTLTFELPITEQKTDIVHSFKELYEFLLNL